MSEEYIPKWHRELEIFSRIKPITIMDGNVLDVYQYPTEGSTPKGSIIRLTDYLYYFYKDKGYGAILYYDNLQGFINQNNPEMVDQYAEAAGAKCTNHVIRARFGGAEEGSASGIIRKGLNQRTVASVVILNLASRYIPSPDNLTQEEVNAFTALVYGSLEAKDVKTERGILKNTLVLIVNKLNDLPAWFYLQNPNVKAITIQTPRKEEREQFVRGTNFQTFFDRKVFEEDKVFYDENPVELEKVKDRFVGLTEGFTFTELNALRHLCKNEKLHIREMCDVIDLYRYGIKENPWKMLDLEEIREAKARFQDRVKGQNYAQEKTLDVIKRAITGLAGAQGSSHGKPKGVLFFAGPTGTGKTETAKTLAEIIFGSEDRCIRFDMSEYSQSHSDQ